MWLSETSKILSEFPTVRIPTKNIYNIDYSIKCFLFVGISDSRKILTNIYKAPKSQIVDLGCLFFHLK